jgi:ABC-type multidrug transport system ATPase subunit
LRSGRAEILGVDLAVDRRTIRRTLALVGHETFCYDDLTVHENLRFATRAAGRPVGAADTALERLGLTRVAGVTHGRLSQGQRRRVSLAIALARDPRLLLLDEPHAGLDEQGRLVLDEVLRAAPAEGRTVLLASHELDLARRLATREVRLAAGQTRDGRSAVAPVRPDRAEACA